jgi:uncharacterized repeat protein (TIGR01451 family)
MKKLFALFSHPSNRKPGRQLAQAMVEFALALPILLLVVYGLLEVGRLIFIYSSVITASREAVRYGSANGLINAAEQYQDCAGIRNAAQKVDFLGDIQDANIIIEYYHGLNPNPFASCPPGTVISGDRIKVTISATFTPIVPIVPLTTMTLRSSSYRTILGNVSVAGATATPSGAIINPPGISKSFLTNPILITAVTTLHFTITNPNASTALTGVAFTDPFPSGMTRAFSPAASQCGGSVTSSTTSVTLSGGVIAAGGSCTVSIDVTAATVGNYLNTSGRVSSTNGGMGNTAFAMLTVNDSAVHLHPIMNKTFLTNPIVSGANTTLRFTITNPNASNTLTGVRFTDTYPSGMTQVSAPTAAQCGGTVSSTSNSISLTNGSLLAGASCNVDVIVTASTAGTLNNTSGVVDSNEGGTGNTATASLVVTLRPPFIGETFELFNIIKQTTSTLTFIIQNQNSSVALTGVAFTDSFPLGLLRAIEPIVPQCGGTVSSTLTSVNLTGGVIPAGGSCIVEIAVTAPINGDYKNTTGNVTSTNGGTGNTAFATLYVTDNPTPSCAFIVSIPEYSNSSKTVTWAIRNTTSGTNPIIQRILIFWNGGRMQRVTLDSVLWWSGDEGPTTFSIAGGGRTLNYGSHAIVFSFPQPTSISGYNFNVLLDFLTPGCPSLTTGSWTVP